MNTKIRFMDENDIQVVVNNDRRILGQSLGEDTYKYELEENPCTYYLIMENAENKAFLGHYGLWIDTPLAQLLMIYVVPELQKNGLGTILMNYIIEFLKEHQVTTLTLEVRHSNLTAIHFYQKFGFKKVAIRKQYYDNGEDADLMLKNI